MKQSFIQHFIFKIILTALLSLCYFICQGQSFVVVNVKGKCTIDGECMFKSDTIACNSTIGTTSTDSAQLLIREVNSAKAYLFTIKGSKKLDEILRSKTNMAFNLREFHINQETAIAARETPATDRSHLRDIIFQDRIEFDIARVLYQKLETNSIVPINNPFDQYLWDLNESTKNNTPCINLVNYNTSSLFVCAIIIENIADKDATVLTDDTYIVKPMTEVTIPCSKRIYPNDTILLISSTENINPHVICEVLPIAEGTAKPAHTFGLNVFTR